MDLSSVLLQLPNEPGVYLYRDETDTVIYVGKARILKNRVRSYFHSKDLNLKTRQLVSRIHDIQYIVTANEMEALLLENNLIKKYKPKYNILLKDDKGYPYLRLDPHQDYPRLELARRMEFDGALYFGPYHGAASANAIAELAQELTPLRTCRTDLSKPVKPCLKYHIGRCPAPCVHRDPQAYRESVDKVIAFLHGDQEEVLNAVRQKMEIAASKLEFEYAAELRDRLSRAGELLNKQKIVLDKDQNLDVIAAELRDGYGSICHMSVRSGRLIGVQNTLSEDVTETENELLTQYILQYYTGGAILPSEILLTALPEDCSVLEALLSEYNKKKVLLHIPQRGKKFDLCLMAKRNAREKWEKTGHVYKDERIRDGLKQLQELLQLPAIPARMECFDISHIQGTDTVASMVVAANGVADKKEYRHFKTHRGNDDFASMREVTSRRFHDALVGKAGFEKLPDLIVIDGGRGQLSSAYSVIHDQLSLDIPMIALAERIEEIYLPHRSTPLLLPRSSPALQILQALRDEAHRFAITFHRSLRSKRNLTSVLDNIEGIGPKRKQALYRAFSTVSRIKEASLEDIRSVPGMTDASAKAVWDHFQAQQ